MSVRRRRTRTEFTLKVTGGGVYQHYVMWIRVWPDYFPSDDEEGLFTLSINPEAKGGRKSPQAVIWAVGRELRAVLGRAAAHPR